MGPGLRTPAALPAPHQQSADVLRYAARRAPERVGGSLTSVGNSKIRRREPRGERTAPAARPARPRVRIRHQRAGHRHEVVREIFERDGAISEPGLDGVGVGGQARSLTDEFMSRARWLAGLGKRATG